MDKFVTWEQSRMLLVSVLSPILGYFTPTKGFILALVVMFAFNIWAGMRADGVAITCCRNFSFKKFGQALAELFLYLAIVLVMFTIMKSCGDEAAGIIVIKSLTYVFMYAYLQNAFRNLIAAYPRIVALRVIYHMIRLEFARAMPSTWKPVLERIDNEFSLAQKSANYKPNEK